MALDRYSTARDILRFEGTDRVAYWKRFSMLLGLSVVIATMGLVRNSGAVVIAAMLIAPLMSPILGIAASMVVGRNRRVLSLLGVVVLAAFLCVGLAWLIVYIADVPKGLVVPREITARTDPGTEDLIIAFAAGVAGAYVQIHRSEVSLLPGAAIGVSLVPPLSATGVLLYLREYADAYEAGLLFATNLAAIVLAACAVYILSGGQSIVLKKGRRRSQFTVSFVATVVILGLIGMQLVSATYNRYTETRAETELARVIQEWSGEVSVEILRVDVNSTRRRADVWIVVDLPFEAQKRVAPIAELLPDELKDKTLANRMRGVLGPNYALAFRYQTRIAGLVFLDTEFVVDAPKTEETTDDE
ncbi:MAG: DUF389 domain-containing protein [Pseudomonadota bacterium]